MICDCINTAEAISTDIKFMIYNLKTKLRNPGSYVCDHLMNKASGDLLYLAVLGSLHLDDMESVSMSRLLRRILLRFVQHLGGHNSKFC